MIVQLAKMPVLQVLLFIRIWIGIGILREVKGEHFANDTISLLWVEEKDNQLKLKHMHSMCFQFTFT